MKKTILIVDDEHSIAESLQELLTWEGYDVVVAADGAKGMKAIIASRPALVLSDYMMPVLNGIQLLRLLRADPAYHDLPFILMSAAPLWQIVGSELAQARLQKPFEATELLRTIERVLAVPPPAGESP